MAGSYNHQAIERKWREHWKKTETDLTDIKKMDNKFYCLDMFPYPSGEGLHVGHWRGYVLSDFYARYWKLRGKNVLHPMGFDSFGLPAENAAIKQRSYPKVFIDQAIKRFRSQLDQIGAAYDWSKIVVTSDPAYYRWTQWLFLQFFKHGLAEKRDALVNWCPKDQTVLANEQVVAGRCERCGSEVTKKQLSQWYLKTTALAQELLDDLKDLDWPEHVKLLQGNWIGRSEGTEVIFASPTGTIKVFTTRVDTLFGVNALVLAPEHPLVNRLTALEQRPKVERYLKDALAKTNVDREQEKITEKTAIFTGSYATHPLTKESLPIWIADYVLTGYGAGAVMSVPAHDERDYQFSQTHHLPIKQVIAGPNSEAIPYPGEGVLAESGRITGLPTSQARREITEELESKNFGRPAVSFRLRDWLVSRQRYWGAPIPIVYDSRGQPHPVKDEHLPLLLPSDVDFRPGGESPIARSLEYKERAEKLYGQGWRFETDTLDTFVDSSWYYLRYLSPTDPTQAFDRKLVESWLPVDLYIGGIEHATMHLLYARFVAKFLAKYGYLDRSLDEPFRKLYNIGMVNLHGAKMSKSKGNVISPDELIANYGADALRGYELFVGPMDVEVEWSPRGINGIYRFLVKLWRLADRPRSEASAKESQLLAAYLQRIEPMIADFRLNTYLSEAMKLVNGLGGKISPTVLGDFVITLSPIFPHLAEEIWRKLGHGESVFQASWPQADKYQASEKLELSVRLNHKHLVSIPVNGGETKAQIVKLIKEIPALGARLEADQRVFYQPGKFIDFVTKD